MCTPPSSAHVPWRCAYASPQPVGSLRVQDGLTDYALLASGSTSRKYVTASSWRGNRLMDCVLHKGDALPLPQSRFSLHLSHPARCPSRITKPHAFLGGREGQRRVWCSKKDAGEAHALAEQDGHAGDLCNVVLLVKREVCCEICSFSWSWCSPSWAISGAMRCALILQAMSSCRGTAILLVRVRRRMSSRS
jgi:hypothetical protein